MTSFFVSVMVKLVAPPILEMLAGDVAHWVDHLPPKVRKVLGGTENKSGCCQQCCTRWDN